MSAPGHAALRAVVLTGAGALLIAAMTPTVMREAPPAAHTGGFGEPTCHACHFQAPIGSGGGSVALSGLPEAWLPGHTYEITVVLRHEGLSLGGFQLAARRADGAQAGSLEPVDTTLAGVTGFRHVQYAHQTWEGARPAAPGELRWTVRWSAPADAEGSVSFHVAANAANDDDSPLGDFVYTASATLPSQVGTASPNP